MHQDPSQASDIQARATAVEIVRHLAAHGHRIFGMEQARDAATEVGLSPDYTKVALHHLARRGWVIRLRRGLYALSSSTPGVTPVHEFEIAMALVTPAAISHWSAMSHHGLTDQPPRRVYIVTTTDASPPRVRNTKSDGFPVAGLPYHFVQVQPERYFGTQKIWLDEARIVITDPERTLLDGLTMPQHCGDLAEVLHAFSVRGSELDIDRIIAYALKLDAATAKRLGWVLEHQKLATDSQLEPLLRLPIKGYRVMDPTGPRKGPSVRRWMIQENLPGRVNA